MKSVLLILVFNSYFFLLGQTKQPCDFSTFIPKGFTLFKTIKGDLNKDKLNDCVLIIKATDKDKIIKNEHNELVDRNRRGIIILFNKKDHYDLILKNTNCFASENEDGGVYYAPELSIEIKKGNIYVVYEHGRYGNWEYTFRYQNSNFELIGYDQNDYNGPITNAVTSINFLSKKKQIKVNTNDSAIGGDEIFKETWKKISQTTFIKLSEIKDFDNLDLQYTEN